MITKPLNVFDQREKIGIFNYFGRISLCSKVVLPMISEHILLNGHMQAK